MSGVSTRGHGKTNQKWTYNEKQEIKNEKLGKCLDVSGASIDNGANVIQWECHGKTNQKWTYDDSTKKRLTNVSSGKCLDVDTGGGTRRNGANVIQGGCHQEINQKWTFWNPDHGRPHRPSSVIESGTGPAGRRESWDAFRKAQESIVMPQTWISGPPK